MKLDGKKNELGDRALVYGNRVDSHGKVRGWGGMPMSSASLSQLSTKVFRNVACDNNHVRPPGDLPITPEFEISSPLSSLPFPYTYQRCQNVETAAPPSDSCAKYDHRYGPMSMIIK